MGPLVHGFIPLQGFLLPDPRFAKSSQIGSLLEVSLQHPLHPTSQLLESLLDGEDYRGDLTVWAK